MSVLAQIVQAAQAYDRFVEQQVHDARTDPASGEKARQRWRQIQAGIRHVTTPTGLTLPRLALPQTEDPGEITRYLHGEGLPGEFPYVNAAYPELYTVPATAVSSTEAGSGSSSSTPPSASPEPPKTEEPTRLFAGLGLAEDTNHRFRFLTRQQKSIRLSTAFDGPTLYGLDSDADGVFGKIGEGGVAIDTIEDMERLYDGFPLGDEHFSVSMTINGPAPILLAMYVAAAKRRGGRGIVSKLRGTVQADILKEVQAQNEIIFPLEASLRFLTDMVEFTSTQMPRWYPISISGYHIAEAGATPVQQAAYTLSNGFTYVELFRERGLDVNQFGPRLSFFLDCGLDVEYLVLARVCRKLWAVSMRDVFGAGPRAQLFKLHTQTSGRSLVAQGFKNNLTRTAVELMLAYANATNSCHSNSADEPFTTPGEEYVRLAARAQAIVLEETGLFKFMMNTLSGSPGMKIVERAVQDAILNEFRELDGLGGVLAAVEHRYQRTQIQTAAHRYEQQINDGTRPIVGLNRYPDAVEHLAAENVVRTPRRQKQRQVERLTQFKRRHREAAARALDALSAVVEKRGNVFAQLLETVEHCSLGQITERLHESVGHYRPTV
ncbi:MAG TPA: methylmalonyl-CoA mutase family protein [Verrucomicrobiae bacterium]|nr:methylmalonyl-CoA mutase family protein [Verrucomicrobiae bacterium]